MTQVALLTDQQAQQLNGQLYATDSRFNPVQDNKDNWFISLEEVHLCDNPEFMWVKDLPLISYNPKQYDLPI